ncbi:MAG TPA: DUF4431 domain-containing protein [Alphaproteobacteria bacterium]|nr:DUF4431 domain-containing protein [Alphaproteobacteria bacterium]
MHLVRAGAILGILYLTVWYGTPAGAAACVDYEPKTVTLTGTISAHVGYGPPNYGEDPLHDEKGTYWWLDLDHPICVNGNEAYDPYMVPERNVTSMEMVYEHAYPPHDEWVGHRVSITGTLFHAFNAHHYTDVLINVVEAHRIPND